MTDRKRAKDTKLFIAAVALIIGSIAATLGFAYLGTAAVWGYPASFTRPLIGSVLGVLVIFTAQYGITGRWGGAAQAIHRAAASAGVLFIGFGIGALWRGNRGIFNAKACIICLLALALIAAWLWRVRGRTSKGKEN